MQSEAGAFGLLGQGTLDPLGSEDGLRGSEVEDRSDLRETQDLGPNGWISQFLADD